jgi:hypothetical protein
VKFDVREMSTADLVRRFAALGVGQYEAELRGELAKQNKLILQMRPIVEELKGRPGDQRTALLALLDHKNIQVRVMAAQLTLAVAPSAARQVLQAIKDSGQQPQALHAGMCLWNLDRGTFKPR